MFGPHGISKSLRFIVERIKILQNGSILTYLSFFILGVFFFLTQIFFSSLNINLDFYIFLLAFKIYVFCAYVFLKK
jgi:hypothetical protein